LDDDTVPGVSIGDTSVVEGNSGITTMTFTVSLAYASGQTITVDYATADGTATIANGDYTTASGTLTFAPGDTTQTFPVSIVTNTLDQPNRALLVNLSNADPTKAKIVAGQAQGVIYDDDGLPDPCTPIIRLQFPVPAPGQYCVGWNMAGNVAAGAAIFVNADNVDIDLKRFTINGGGSAASEGYGIYARDRKGVSVHGGTIRGFFKGVFFDKSPLSSHSQTNTVQSIIAVGNTYAGIWMEGTANAATSNTVRTTGGTTVFGTDSDVFGIAASGTDSKITGNTILDAVAVGSGNGNAIWVSGGMRDTISSNVLTNTAATACGSIGGNCSIGIFASPGATESTQLTISLNRLSLFDYGIVFSGGSSGQLFQNANNQVTTAFERR
jgi:hypothetical protein